MYKYLVAFVLLSPLVGIWLVEGGEYAASIGIEGYPNGASLAYGIYALAVAVIGWGCVAWPRQPRRVKPQVEGVNAEFRHFGRNLLVFNTIFLFVFLFGFGAIGVWTGGIGKGEFRTNLGVLGAVPSTMTKFVIPALLAYLAALYRKSSSPGPLRWLLGINLLVASTIGASWGFKTFAFTILLPALLTLFWQIRIKTLVTLILVFVGELVLFFQLFDAGLEVDGDMQTLLVRRITVLQGDVSWYMWDQYTNGEVFPDYLPTLLAVFGDKVLTVFGLSRDAFKEWTLYHYDFMITNLAGAPLDQIQEGHNITATPFSEGLVAGGVFGVAFFAVVGGLLVGWMYRFIDRSLREGRDIHAAIGATYFVLNVFPWLNGGGVVTLFHISVLVGLGITVLAMRAMQRFHFGASLPRPKFT